MNFFEVFIWFISICAIISIFFALYNYRKSILITKNVSENQLEIMKDIELLSLHLESWVESYNCLRIYASYEMGNSKYNEIKQLIGIDYNTLEHQRSSHGEPAQVDLPGVCIGVG